MQKLRTKIISHLLLCVFGTLFFGCHSVDFHWAFYSLPNMNYNCWASQLFYGAYCVHVLVDLCHNKTTAIKHKILCWKKRKFYTSIFGLTGSKQTVFVFVWIKTPDPLDTCVSYHWKTHSPFSTCNNKLSVEEKARKRNGKASSYLHTWRSLAIF